MGEHLRPCQLCQAQGASPHVPVGAGEGRPECEIQESVEEPPDQLGPVSIFWTSQPSVPGGSDLHEVGEGGRGRLCPVQEDAGKAPELPALRNQQCNHSRDQRETPDESLRSGTAPAFQPLLVSVGEAGSLLPHRRRELPREPRDWRPDSHLRVCALWAREPPGGAGALRSRARGSDLGPGHPMPRRRESRRDLRGDASAAADQGPLHRARSGNRHRFLRSQRCAVHRCPGSLGSGAQPLDLCSTAVQSEQGRAICVG
mmetsp:Transcript_105064/g.250096  ORF Transcript_105064/g.250096 Transcript_105064/m.250096 type:complete len:258 (-) Transcript_105064:615-1388(-)